MCNPGFNIHDIPPIPLYNKNLFPKKEEEVSFHTIPLSSFRFPCRNWHLRLPGCRRFIGPFPPLLLIRVYPRKIFNFAIPINLMELIILVMILTYPGMNVKKGIIREILKLPMGFMVK